MNHCQAHALLALFVDGELDPRRDREVQIHLSECTECQSWLETYDLVSSSLKPAAAPAPRHLSSDELCSYALMPEALSELTRARAVRHAGSCSSCAAEIGLVRASVGDTKISDSLHKVSTRLRTAALPSGLAVAAMLLLGFGLVLFTRQEATAPTRVQATAPHDVTLNEGRFESRESIGAERSINVEHTVVVSGAGLTLEGKSVAFGEGFSVEAGAALVVVTHAVGRDT